MLNITGKLVNVPLWNCKEGNILDEYYTIPRTMSNLSLTECRTKKKMNIATKADQRATVRSSFWIYHPNFETGRVRNNGQNSQLIRDLPYFRNPLICSVCPKSPQSVRFFRPNPSIHKPIHPSFRSLCPRKYIYLKLSFPSRKTKRHVLFLSSFHASKIVQLFLLFFNS